MEVPRTGPGGIEGRVAPVVHELAEVAVGPVGHEDVALRRTLDRLADEEAGVV